MSQRLVDDPNAAQLMPDFYRQILIGALTHAEALRQAPLRIREKNSDARYWAPFVLIGV